MITESDLKDCFENTAVRLPDFSFNALRDIIDGDFFDRNLLDHNSITSATEKLVCWLCACHREVARITTIVKPQDLEAEVYRLYTVGLDELHSVLRQLQKGLVELGYTPVGCGVEDGCPNLHIRYVTRLDFEALNVAVLMHSHLRKYLSIRGDDPSFREMLRESERRVRRSLKLAPFYMMAYAAGEDPHMVRCSSVCSRGGLAHCERAPAASSRTTSAGSSRDYLTGSRCPSSALARRPGPRLASWS